MRALRVVGVTGDGSVVLEDPGRRERYTVPADEQLRAAARGDVTRLGQIAIELESQLRPREIQARIRGGASVDEVAAAAGVPIQKIERFAYPVLLERSRTAELAQGAHPQRADGPDSRTLGETVAHTFGLRGQDYSTAGWDSWKGEDGKWVVALTWQTGRSDNAAHWAFQPGAHGGTVVPLDEHASDLIEGLPARPLRPLGAVVDMAREDEQAPTPSEPATAAPARAVAGGQAPGPAESWAGRGIAPEQRRSSPPPRPRVETPARPATHTDEGRPTAAAAPVIPRTESDGDAATSPADTGSSAERPSGAAAEDAATAPDAGGSDDADTAGTGVTEPGPAAAGADPAAADTDLAAAGTDVAAAGTDIAGSEPAGSDTPSGTTAAGAPSSEPGAADTATGSAAGTTPTETTPAETTPAGTGTAAETPAARTSADDDAPRLDSVAAKGASPATDGEEDTTSAEEAEPASRPRGGAASRRTKKGKPVMPSWDEVLLGVRGQR